MNTLTIVKLLCAILIFDCVLGQRISKLKCEEMASLNTNIGRYPYLMEIVLQDGPSVGVATLISEDYVLTTAHLCLDLMKNSSENSGQKYLMRKSKLTDRQYPDTKFYTIKRFVPHELYKLWDRTNNVGLIQLDEEVSYVNSTSTLRPACLWTDNIVPESDMYLISIFEHGYESYLMLRITAALIDDDVGSNISFSINSKNNDYSLFNRQGTVDVKVESQYYVIAVIFIKHSTGNQIKFWGNKVSSYIPWIESIVWPNHTDQATLLECGQRKIKHKPLMTYSEPTYHGEFPWHVALYRIQKYICGGTILNSRTILTAAHCVHDERGTLPPNRIIVIAGTHNLNEYPIEAENYVVEAITVHPNFRRAYLENDIALLKLGATIEFSSYIQPICISNIFDHSNISLGLVAGWGRNEHNQSSGILLQATFPIIDEFECRESNRDFFPTYLNSYNYCAGYGNGTNVCSGDSGGSMVFEHKSRWFIRGIVSLGVARQNSNECDLTQLVLFTNVTKFYDWIENEKFTEL